MKSKPHDSLLNVDIGIPASLTNETGMAVMTAENLISCYENEARKILKEKGLPLTFHELWEDKEKYLPDLANGRGTSQAYSVFWMLWGLELVKDSLQKKDAEQAVCNMAYALNWASKMQIKPLEPSIMIGTSRRKKQKETREKRKTWRGRTREQLSERNQSIVEHFKKSRLTINHFANKYADKYDLKPTRIRQIISIVY